MGSDRMKLFGLWVLGWVGMRCYELLGWVELEWDAMNCWGWVETRCYELLGLGWDEMLWIIWVGLSWDEIIRICEVYNPSSLAKFDKQFILVKYGVIAS